MIKLFSVLLFTSAAFYAGAQQDQDNVKKAMWDYIEGFYQGDSAKIIRSISPRVAKYGYWKDKKTGVYAGETMSYEEMIKYAVDVKAKNRQHKTDSITKAEIFELQDQTANGKVTAWWGTDYVLLEKTNNKWMIRMVLWQGPLKK